MMNCYNSRVKVACLALGVLLLTAMSGLAVWSGTLAGYWVGGLGLAFFGLGGVLALGRELQPGPRVVINNQGIEDRRLGTGLIRWREILDVSIRTVQQHPFLCIDLVDPEKQLAKMPLWRRPICRVNRLMGFPEIAIDLHLLEANVDEVWQYVSSRHRTLVLTGDLSAKTLDRTGALPDSGNEEPSDRESRCQGRRDEGRLVVGQVGCSAA